MTRTLAPLLALLLIVAACSSDGSVSSDFASPAPTAAAAESASDDTPSANSTSETLPEEVEEAIEEAQAASDASDATATVTLENGEEFTFGILCALESQEAAGLEILFTVVSYDTPYNLDVTQFGDNDIGAGASIDIYDSDTYDMVWSADASHGGEATLELNGTTVTGTGMFLAGEEGAGPAVAGELVAHC